MRRRNHGDWVVGAKVNNKKPEVKQHRQDGQYALFTGNPGRIRTIADIGTAVQVA